ncbi:hypothetical protein OEZ86_014604 [Tetradesmus obliquus]|nr:hypothetical protein OEZ86_014604 [Tetradesmus obliquus]
MTSQTTRGHKRKLADNNSGPSPSREPSSSVVEAEVKSLIQTVRDLSSRPVEKSDRAALRKAAHALADYCKTDELVELIVQNGAVDAVVPLLTIADKAEPTVHQSFTEVRKEACFILGLLAVKPEYQHQIATAQALPGLVKLLQAHNISSPPARTASFGGASGGGNERSGSGGVARRAADAITNLAHENLEIKNMVRQDGGIAPLVRLLSSWDLKVQRAGAGALRTLAFKNDDNKRQIVDCGALPLLIQMLRSEDPGVHYEAVGVIGNLVHSSQDIKQRVLEEGALQPVINLLGSSCSESQREAALLLGQFATQTPNDDGPDYKSRIVQRGAVPPLIRMLSAPDTALKEMAAFALGRLAQNSHNQAGIVQGGGLPLLLELLESKHINLQHNAAFALYGISDNEDNIPCIIQVGGLQRLHDCGERLTVQASKDCVNKTIARIKQKLERDDKRVLNHVIYTMRSSDRSVQQAVAVSLAQLAPTGELKNIFVDKAGLDVLLELLTDRGATAKTLQDGAAALLELAKKVNATSPVEAQPQQPTKSVYLLLHASRLVEAQPQQPTKSVYLGEEYVNSKTLADICFLVEGRPFYAHRIALLASSEAFRAMFNQGFRESEASSIDIPNISYETFTAMMRYIYVGSVEVEQELALPLLQASDQYLLEGLKRLCEAALAQSLSVENLVDVWQASEAYSAPQLAKRCVLFALEHCTEIIALDSAAAGGGAVAGSGSVCGSTPTGSSLVSQASASMQIGGAAAFAELMIRMVPALRLLPLKLWQSTKQPPQKALTIFTTPTKDRLDMLDAQCTSWPGPLAAVVYVPVLEKAQSVERPGEFTEDQLEEVRAAQAAVQAVFNSVVYVPVLEKAASVERPGEFTEKQLEEVRAAQAAVQAVFNRAEAVNSSCVLTLLLSYEYVQPDMVKQLPVNSMRNHALLLAQTPLVSLLDVDLMASNTMAQALTDPQQVKELQDIIKGQQRFVVLPAFEPMPIKERFVENMSGAAMSVVLRQQQKVAAFAAANEKATLQGLMNAGLLQPFDKGASPFGHKATDFNRWLTCKEQRCPSYEIKPESERFEPWGVLDRHQALRNAPYDEVYRGYGKNKISNIWWLREQGFKLFVHGTAFIVHRAHATSNAKVAWRKERRERMPINTQKFDRAMEAMKEKRYAPKLHASTAACIQQELLRISRREQ